MNKASILCDTNLFAYFFEGYKEAGKIINLYNIVTSSVTYIEVLNNKKIPLTRWNLMKDFMQTLTIIETNPFINNIAIDFRLRYSVDTPYAIIAATAKYLNIKLATADKEFFKIKEIEIIPFTK